MNQLVLPSAKSFAVEHAWRLNKRHCDVLQGLDKAETAARLDDAHVKIWRRAFITSLPPWRRVIHSLGPTMLETPIWDQVSSSRLNACKMRHAS